MTESELRELASALNYQSWSEWRTENESKFAQAAEVLELVAWAEESSVRLAKGPLCWITKIGDAYISAPTLIDTLRRAKEASDG